MDFLARHFDTVWALNNVAILTISHVFYISLVLLRSDYCPQSSTNHWIICICFKRTALLVYYTEQCSNIDHFSCLLYIFSTLRSDYFPQSSTNHWIICICFKRTALLVYYQTEYCIICSLWFCQISFGTFRICFPTLADKLEFRLGIFGLKE
jgi:hypothetical protein